MTALYLCLCLQSGLHDSAQKGGNVDDQTDASIPKNCGTSDSGKGSKCPAQWLHYRLHAAEQFINCDAGMKFVDLDHDHVFPLRGLTGDAEHMPQTDVGNGGSAEAEYSTGLETALFGRQFGAFGHVLERDDKSFVANADREAFDNGQGQGQADRNGAAFSGSARYLGGAA